mgnify:CR=1 FL=1
MNKKQLVEKALEARQQAYAPYSHFPVGAALVTSTGKVFTGCNVEQATYGGTICAERTAIVKAVSEGEKEIEAICCVADTEDFCTPCGICRQFIYEFGPNIEVIMANNKGEYRSASISELLPNAFGSDSLKKNY